MDLDMALTIELSLHAHTQEDFCRQTQSQWFSAFYKKPKAKWNLVISPEAVTAKLVSTIEWSNSQ